MKKIRIETLSFEELREKHEIDDAEHMLNLVEGLNKAQLTCINYNGEEWEIEAINHTISLLLDLMKIE